MYIMFVVNLDINGDQSDKQKTCLLEFYYNKTVAFTLLDLSAHPQTKEHNCTILKIKGYVQILTRHYCFLAKRLKV